MDKLERVVEFLIIGAGAIMFYYVSRNVSNQAKEKRSEEIVKPVVIIPTKKFL